MTHIRRSIFFTFLLLIALSTGLAAANPFVTMNVTPIANFTADLYMVVDGSPFGPFSYTFVNGKATMSLMPAHTYTFELRRPGYLPSWANNATSSAAAASFVLNDDDRINTFFNFPSGVTVSGTVRNRPGVTLSGQQVNLFDSANNWLTYATTDVNGVYSFTNITNGNYFVQANDVTGVYFPQFYNDAFGYGDRVTVSVSGANRPGINFSLYERVTINGTVKNHLNANMQDVWVYAFVNAGNYLYVNKVTTNAFGVYNLPVPASVNVIVKFEKENYFDAYAGSYDRSLASNFFLAPHTTSNNINVTMQRISTINGVVSNNVGAGVVGAEVFAFIQSASFNYVNKVTTGVGGSYTLTVPSSTNIMLRASANTYVPVFYDQVYTQSLSKTMNLSTASTTNIRFTLIPGGSIAGSVTVYGGTGSVVTINVEDVNGNYFTSVTRSATGGAYSITQIPAGQWKVKAIKAGCVSEYHGETASTADAVTVNVPAGGTASNINIEIAPSWSITGYVTTLGSGAPVVGATVQVYKWNGNWQYIDGTISVAGGYYELMNGYGTQNVFVKASYPGMRDQFYDSSEGPWASANMISMAPNAPETGIDFHLYQYGTISGTITNSLGGAGESGVTVSAFSYGPTWNYIASTLSVTGGGYSLSVMPGQALKIKAEKANFIPELYNNVQNISSWNFATTVSVSSGGTSSNINFGLDPLWSITGNASPAGTLVEVFGYNNWQDFVGQYIVTAAGTYTISGTGNAKQVMVRFSQDAGNYVRVLYPTLNYFSDISPANRLTVTAGNAYGLAPVTLALGGRVMGTITVYGGTGPVVTVNIENTDGKYFTDVTINAAGGAYTAPRIPAGQWKVKARKGGLISEYYGETAATKDATTVNVTSGGTASAINIEIAPSWSITGTINISGTSTPIVGALVQVFKKDQHWAYIAEATTDASGRYTITEGYNTGNVFLKASAAGYVPLLFFNKIGDWDSSDTLNMAPLMATTNIDFPLYAMATVNGTVRTSALAPIPGVTVSAYSLTDGSLVATANTDGAGFYQLSVLPQTPLRIVAAKPLFLTTAYPSTVNVASSGISSNIDITLPQSWRVAGVVSSSKGGVLASILVRMYLEASPSVVVASAYTNGSGYYELASTSDVTASVFIRSVAVQHADYQSTTFNVVLGSTNITTYNVLMISTVTYVSSIGDTIKSGPNPCNPDEGPVYIGFKVNETGTARIRIFTLGRELVFDESIQCVPGNNIVEWEGHNLYNESIPNGMYLAYVEVDSAGKKVKKVLKIAILR